VFRAGLIPPAIIFLSHVNMKKMKLLFVTKMNVQLSLKSINDFEKTDAMLHFQTHDFVPFHTPLTGKLKVSTAPITIEIQKSHIVPECLWDDILTSRKVSAILSKLQEHARVTALQSCK
jgi:hypothetical protein